MEYNANSSLNSNAKDHLSAISNDCLYDIFYRLNHYDLDELSTLNRRLRKLTDAARTKAGKIKAFKLELTQVLNGDLRLVKIDYPKRKKVHILETKNPRNYLKCKTVFLETKCPRISADCLTLSSISPFLKQSNKMKRNRRRARSESDSKTNSFVVDDQFLDWLQNIVQYSPTKHLCFVDLLWGDCDREETGKRLLSILIPAKISRLGLNIVGTEQFVCEDSLKKYVQIVPLGALSISSDDDYKLNCVLRVSNEFCDVLSQFGKLSMMRLVVNTNGLIQAIMNRLRHKCIGFWKFRTTEHIGINEIRASLGSDMQYIPSGNKHKIMLRDSAFYVIFWYKEKNIQSFCSFEADFLYIFK